MYPDNKYEQLCASFKDYYDANKYSTCKKFPCYLKH